MTGRIDIKYNGNRLPVIVLSNYEVKNDELIRRERYSYVTYDDVFIGDSAKMNWPGGGTEVPSSPPKCGFHNEKCTVGECHHRRRVLQSALHLRRFRLLCLLEKNKAKFPRSNLFYTRILASNVEGKNDKMSFCCHVYVFLFMGSFPRKINILRTRHKVLRPLREACL